MTRRRVLLDTGPLVAILNKRDGAHADCVRVLKRIPGPFVTCWPVVTEAAWLLRNNAGLPSALMQAFATPFFTIEQIDQSAGAWLAAFYARYGQRRVQLADACLVYLANKLKIERFLRSIAATLECI